MTTLLLGFAALRAHLQPLVCACFFYIVCMYIFPVVIYIYFYSLMCSIVCSDQMFEVEPRRTKQDASSVAS
jgi:uncharacterized membrane protein